MNIDDNKFKSTETIIPTEDIKYLYRRRVDPVGEVFFWKNRVFRGIHFKQEQSIIDLMDSGLLKKLEAENLIATTEISKYTNPKYSLILEHSLISPQINSEEMVFDMIKDAAISIIKIAKIAYKYNYELKDCHLQNILFDGTAPKFIDIGSFIKIKNKTHYKWNAEDEFLRVYIYPLTLWTIGFEDYAKKLYLSKTFIFTSNYYRIRHPLFNIIPKKLHYKLIKLKNKYINKTTDFNKLYKKIESLSTPSTTTKWANYSSNIDTKNPRFNKVIEIINNHCQDANNCIDIAGNSGLLTKSIIKNTHVKKAICLDYDDEAIKKGYLENKPNKELTFINQDFMSSISFINEEPIYSRLKSDIALCLALTHHLLLTQKFDINDILINLSKITNKYLIIEFMPKGLWSIENQHTIVPIWYTQEWFENQLNKHFKIKYSEEVATNRILYFGVKNDSN